MECVQGTQMLYDANAALGCCKWQLRETTGIDASRYVSEGAKRYIKQKGGTMAAGEGKYLTRAATSCSLPALHACRLGCGELPIPGSCHSRPATGGQHPALRVAFAPVACRAALLGAGGLVFPRAWCKICGPPTLHHAVVRTEGTLLRIA
jgi:hypothetical protein